MDGYAIIAEDSKSKEKIKIVDKVFAEMCVIVKLHQKLQLE